MTVDRDGASCSPTGRTTRRRTGALIGKVKALLQRLDVLDHEHVAAAPQHTSPGRIPLPGVAHQNGTIRFGEDPATSALDIDCRAHEVDNLYVVDASFFRRAAPSIRR